jgi:hypothetical protein
MGLGLSGTHRCGKSTLAREIAKANSCPFAESSASAIAAEMGIIVDPGLPYAVRLEFQERVLTAFTASYEAAGNGLFVADRTPLDLAAYLILDWNGRDSTPEMDAQTLSYIERCFAVANRYFFQITAIQPGIPYKIEEGKPRPNPLYQELLNTTIIGLLYDERLKPCIQLVDRHVLDLGERVDLLSGEYGRNFKGYREDLGKSLAVN